MSSATTASPSRAAYRISNTTDRTAAVTGSAVDHDDLVRAQELLADGDPRLARQMAPGHHGYVPLGDTAERPVEPGTAQPSGGPPTR